MTINEKLELANLLGNMGICYAEEDQTNFRETLQKATTLVDNIKCSDDNTPHNFTPDVQNIEEHIDTRSDKKSRLMLVYYSLTSLLIEALDELDSTFPQKQKLKQFAKNYTKLLEDEVRTGYALAGDNQLHFSQWQNLIKLGTVIFIQAVIDEKAHDYLGFLVAFANGECKYEITDKEFSKGDVDNQAAFELWDMEIKNKVAK